MAAWNVSDHHRIDLRAVGARHPVAVASGDDPAALVCGASCSMGRGLFLASLSSRGPEANGSFACSVHSPASPRAGGCTHDSKFRTRPDAGRESQ